MLSTAYIAHFNAPRFFRELKDSSIPRFGKVTGISFGISTFIYAAVSAMAFLTFGANCDGLILNNYSTKDLLISASRFAVAISLIFSYPLLFVGTRDGTLDLLKVPEEKRSASLLNQTTFGLLGIVTALAWKLTDLSFVSSISGAVFGTALIFVYPSLMFRAAIKNIGDKAPARDKKESSFAMLVNIVGIVIGIIGTKMALGTA
jgi:amino acid permease